ncbi:hypothetical protein FGB62_29g119 [Gracilaria domingensis]|nr:hypothetical protein FGB62_29g119 [Gracilaria domingensis]
MVKNGARTRRSTPAEAPEDEIYPDPAPPRRKKQPSQAAVPSRKLRSKSANTSARSKHRSTRPQTASSGHVRRPWAPFKGEVKATYAGTNEVGSHWVKVLVKVGKYGHLSPEGSTKCIHCNGGGDNGFGSRQQLINHLESKGFRVARGLPVSALQPKDKLGRTLLSRIDDPRNEVLVEKKLKFNCRYCKKNINYQERFNHCVKCWLKEHGVQPVQHVVRRIGQTNEEEPPGEEEEVLAGSDCNRSRCAHGGGDIRGGGSRKSLAVRDMRQLGGGGGGVSTAGTNSELVRICAVCSSGAGLEPITLVAVETFTTVEEKRE